MLTKDICMKKSISCYSIKSDRIIQGVGPNYTGGPDLFLIPTNFIVGTVPRYMWVQFSITRVQLEQHHRLYSE